MYQESHQTGVDTSTVIHFYNMCISVYNPVLDEQCLGHSIYTKGCCDLFGNKTCGLQLFLPAPLILADPPLTLVNSLSVCIKFHDSCFKFVFGYRRKSVKENFLQTMEK